MWYPYVSSRMRLYIRVQAVRSLRRPVLAGEYRHKEGWSNSELVDRRVRCSSALMLNIRPQRGLNGAMHEVSQPIR